MFELQSRPALLVVDMQNGFCHEKGTFGSVSTAVMNLGRQLTSLQKSRHPNSRHESRRASHQPPAVGVPQAWRAGLLLPPRLSADYSDSGITLAKPPASAVKDVQGFVRGTWDAGILDELQPTNMETVFDKTRNSAFRGTDFESMLRKRGVGHLILVGVGTNVCVESTARDAFQSDFFTTTVSDATATDSQEGHDAAMKTLVWFGGTATVAEVETALAAKV